MCNPLLRVSHFEAHVAEFRLPETKVAETEGEMAVRVQLRKEPEALPSGVKMLTTGSKSMVPCFWSSAARWARPLSRTFGRW
jgi:hypothetical protein